jgi:hypothetical protein
MKKKFVIRDEKNSGYGITKHSGSATLALPLSLILRTLPKIAGFSDRNPGTGAPKIKLWNWLSSNLKACQQS